MPEKPIITGQHITSAKAQRARELRREMTPAERLLWARLRANRLQGFHFRRQQIIEPYIVDFYCHQAGLIIEVDGDVHATGSKAMTGSANSNCRHTACVCCVSLTTRLRINWTKCCKTF